MTKTTTYKITITNAMQTPAIVYETLERAKSAPLRILLEHEEPPNIVRGTMQELTRPRHHEVRRPDGGFSWYHAGTFCFMYAEPVPSVASKKHSDPQEDWGERIKHHLSAFSGKYGANLKYDNSDIFVDGKHLVGMSARTAQGVRVQRACWYEQNPILEISDLLIADGISPQAFASKLAIVEPGFFQYFMEQLEPSNISAQEFVSPLSKSRARELQRKTGKPKSRGSCVLGPVGNSSDPVHGNI